MYNLHYNISPRLDPPLAATLGFPYSLQKSFTLIVGATFFGALGLPLSLAAAAVFDNLLVRRDRPHRRFFLPIYPAPNPYFPNPFLILPLKLECMSFVWLVGRYPNLVAAFGNTCAPVSLSVCPSSSPFSALCDLAFAPLGH